MKKRKYTKRNVTPTKQDAFFAIALSQCSSEAARKMFDDIECPDEEIVHLAANAVKMAEKIADIAAARNA